MFAKYFFITNITKLLCSSSFGILGETQAQWRLGLWQRCGLKTLGFPGKRINWLFVKLIISSWFQAEECALRSAVDRFNNRRFGFYLRFIYCTWPSCYRYDRGGGGGQEKKEVLEGEFFPVDNCINSVLGQEVELSEEFKANYERWLQREVYGTQIDWDQLLEENHLW